MYIYINKYIYKSPFKYVYVKILKSLPYISCCQCLGPASLEAVQVMKVIPLATLQSVIQFSAGSRNYEFS